MVIDFITKMFTLPATKHTLLGFFVLIYPVNNNKKKILKCLIVQPKNAEKYVPSERLDFPYRILCKI